MIDDIAEELLQIEKERNLLEKERNKTLVEIRDALHSICGGMP